MQGCEMSFLPRILIFLPGGHYKPGDETTQPRISDWETPPRSAICMFFCRPLEVRAHSSLLRANLIPVCLEKTNDCIVVVTYIQREM